MKCTDLLETVVTMVITDEKLKWWVAREVKHLRENFMEANGIKTQKEFASKIGMEWKNIYNVEERIHVPGIDLLNQIVTGCESNLAKFFSGLFTRMELAEMERQDKAEQEMMFTLAKGLSRPITKRIVQAAADHVAEVLRLLEAQ